MCVIISRGTDQYWEMARELIREGQSVVVRLVNEGDPNATIFAYRGAISKLMSAVGRWLVIDYPRNLQIISLRQHSRLPVYLNCRLQSLTPQSETFSALLKDLSLNGSGIVTEEIPHSLSQHPFKLELSIEGQKSVAIKVRICNQRLEHGSSSRIHYGLSFEANEREKQQLIEAALLEIIQRENKLPG